MKGLFDLPIYRPGLKVTLAAWICAFFAVQTRAADPAPTATAHVRFWKTALADFPNLRVSFKPLGGRGGGAGKEIGAGGPGYAFGNYQDVPPGRGTLELFAGTDRKVLASVPADFGAETYSTILLTEPEQKGGSPHLESLNDIPDKEAATQITVRNFVPGFKRLDITIGDSLTAHFVSGHEYLRMRGLKADNYLIKTTGVDADGKNFEWNTEADFRHSSRQTLLVYPDAYGRIRPRLFADGEMSVPAADADSTGQR